MRDSGRASNKSIYEYGNYRQFLSDFFAAQKEKDKSFTYRFFAKKAGFQSFSFFNMVLQGKRNLTLDSIEKIANVLKLNKDESFFFRNLVLLNQAKTSDEKQTYADQLMKSREYRKAHPLSEAQYQYFSHWFYVPVRELVGLEGFREDYDWIARQINPMITAYQAKTAVEKLIVLGLLKRDENGKLLQCEEDVTTPDEVVSAYAAQYHKEMINKGVESIKTVPREKREISALTFVVAPEDINKIKEIIQKCKKEIVEATTHKSGYKSVFQLNFQLFPLAEISNEEKNQ